MSPATGHRHYTRQIYAKKHGWRRLALRFGAVELVAAGTPIAYDERAAAAQMAGPEVAITLDLGLGEASGVAWTCDLSAEYVSINADYRT